MKTYKYLLFILITLALHTSCEEFTNKPFTSEVPLAYPVKNVTVENRPGEVKLRYELPSDKNLLYVVAECVINGRILQDKASYHTDSLILRGFPDASEYEVKIYSVNRSEARSTPISIKVNPLEPPYKSIYSSLNMFEDFGGVTVKFSNQAKAEIALSVIVKDSIGDWKDVDTYYTKNSEGSFSVRGFDPETMEFGVYVKDRWNHISDTLVQELTPIFEMHLERSKFFEYYLPTDQKAAWGWYMHNLWDGVLLHNVNVDHPGFHTAPGGLPQWFTFSLGVKAKLSRFRYYQRGQYFSFADRNIKKFEIWGSNNPDPDGGWNNWTLLLTGESVKPSGLPPGQNSQEDMDLITRGEEFLFPIENEPVTYIRFKVLETWGHADHFYIMGVDFWGAEVE